MSSGETRSAAEALSPEQEHFIAKEAFELTKSYHSCYYCVVVSTQLTSTNSPKRKALGITWIIGNLIAMGAITSLTYTTRWPKCEPPSSW